MVIVAKSNKRRGIKTFAIVMGLFLIAIVLLGLVFIDNKNIMYEHFDVASENLNSQEIKIAHLSDLHFPKIEVNIDKLAQQLQNKKPDIIAITGDLIDDSAKVELCGVTEFLDKIKSIAPIFYVNGNHEVRNSESMFKLSQILKARGAIILDNNSVNVLIGQTEITVIGLSDNVDYDSKYLDGNLSAKTNFKILLAHRPEKWDNYIAQEDEVIPNLILSGHVHGGQFRFFGQGLFAPSQGIFPKYDSGSYSTADGNCTMIVSRGIGSSVIPFRFNNNPHVPIITIK